MTICSNESAHIVRLIDCQRADNFTMSEAFYFWIYDERWSIETKFNISRKYSLFKQTFVKNA